MIKIDRVRNPLAIRNGEIIGIDDLTSEENGLKCNCYCPCCKGKFEAKMGDKRIHHFAHNHDGCDEELAFLCGLYKAFKQFLDLEDFTLPKLSLFCRFGIVEKITESNFDEFVNIHFFSGCNDVFECCAPKKIKFDETEIVYSDKKRPIAVIARIKKKQLAIVIQAPKIGCNFHKVTQYKDYATIKLDVSNVDIDEFYHINNVYNYFRNESRQWISNPSVIKYIDKIQNENFLIYEENQKKNEQLKKQQIKDMVDRQRKSAELEKLKKKKMMQKRQQKESDERNKRDLLEILKQTKITYYKENNLGIPDVTSNGLYKFVESFGNNRETLSHLEVDDKFFQDKEPIRDHWGKRWLRCRKCNIIAVESDFTDERTANFGICKKCAYQKS